MACKVISLFSAVWVEQLLKLFLLLVSQRTLFVVGLRMRLILVGRGVVGEPSLEVYLVWMLLDVDLVYNLLTLSLSREIPVLLLFLVIGNSGKLVRK